MLLPTILRAVALLAILLRTSPAEAQTDPPTLARVVVYGVDPEQDALVRARIQLRPGDPVSERDSLAVERALADVLFPMRAPRVGFAPSGEEDERLDLVVDYRPDPSAVEIRVYPLCVDLEPEPLLAALPIAVGDECPPQMLKAAAEALREAVVAAGVHDAEVVPHHARLTDDTIAVGFIVARPEPVKVRKREFPGAGWMVAPRIRQFFDTMEPKPFAKGGMADPALLKTVERTTVDLMRSEGYLQAKVRLSETRVTRKGLDAVYRIERGPRYRVGSSVATGVALPDAEFWEPSTRPAVGKSITSSRMREQEESLRRRAQTLGYMDPEIETDYEASHEELTVAVTTHIDEGTTSTMGIARIERESGKRGYGKSWYHRGVAPPLKEEVLRRQVRVRQGEALDRRVLDDAERRLWRLGTFESVEVDTAPTTDTLVRDVVARVKERRTATLGASVGWNDQIGPVAGLTFTEGNVGGRADRLTYGGWTSLDSQGFGGEITYFDRYFKPGEKIVGAHREPSMLYAAYVSDFAYDEYSERRVGGRVKGSYIVGDPWGYWSNSWIPRVERVSFARYRDKDDYAEDFDSYWATTLAYHLTYDSRNRGEENSTRGFLFDTGIEAGGADGALVKWTNLAEWHRPIARRWGWKTTGQFGLIPMDSEDVALGERFHSGGLGSVRGFEQRGIGPVDARNEDMHSGGSTMTALQNEIRYIYSKDVEFPLFVDAGTLDEEALGWGKLRASAGFGARFKIPGMQQRAYIYLAEGLLGESTDNERSIHFGFTFGL